MSERLVRKIRLPLLTCLLVLASACDSSIDQQDAFFEEAAQVPSGFTETNDRGSIVSVDEDDWRTAPFYRGRVRVSPVFPNPGTQTGPINLTVAILFSDAVQRGLVVRARRSDGVLITLDTVQRTQPGNYVLTFNAATLGRTGLVRLFILDSIGNASGDIISYGDLMIR